MTDAPAAPASRLPPLLALVGLALLVLALALYAARRTIAREALTAWLRSKGVAADTQVQAIGPAGVTGAIRIGDPRAPDLTVARVELGYGLRGLGLEVRSVRLVRPVLRARLQGGRLSAGALDPLIEEFRKAPPRPGAAPPRIQVQDGVLQLQTDYGRLAVRGDAVVEQGRLLRLAATTAPTRLQGRGVFVELGAGAVNLLTQGARVELSLDAPARSASAGGLSAQNARLRISAAGPYPDQARSRAAGAVVAHAELAGGRIAAGGQALRNGLLSAAFTGQASGWIADFALTGRAVADLRAAAADAGGGTAGALRASAVAEDFSWTRRRGDALHARLAASGLIDSYDRDGLKLTAVTAAAQGPVAFGPKGADLRLTLHALGRGGWAGLGAPAAGDSADIAAVKRAARGFRFAAPALAFRSAGGPPTFSLSQPVTLIPDRGGVVTLAQLRPGWRLTAAGGGLPAVTADIDRITQTPGGPAASGRIRAALSIGPVEHSVVDAAGTLHLAGGAMAFSSARCATFTAARLVFGANDLRQLSGDLCPAGRPLLELGRG
ncbi:MAG: hypothetical protein JWQ97_3999, partial [Phenylobacterium sp.]|nr:hypothetical protein [Phenylobacterium sp.]